MRKHSLSLKIVTGVTLAFFCWSFLPLYSAVAFAVEKQVPGAGSRGPGNQATGYRAQGPDVPVTASSRFEKALETIRENINKADDKESKSQDITAEVTEVKKQRTEIEKLDGDLKAEFAATEKKLKDANLPKEILDRHYKFVKHYEDNLKELKTNLSAVEQSAISGKQKKETLAKAKAHLEKTKAPSRHQKLDPNNLPFRNRKEAKPIAPRLKKEEFERDFPKQKKQSIRTAFSPQSTQSAQRTASLLDRDQRGWARILDSALSRYSSPFTSHASRPLATSPLTPNPSRILLASNEPVSDIPFTLDANATAPKIAFSDPSPIILAQADLPSAEDLAETPEVQFTQDIRDLAAQLGNKSTKIFEWVRNNIEFIPSYGSIQGADMCLQSRQCNDMDTASLLIALLRVSNFPARYMYGTIEIPIDKAMNWFGGFTDPSAAVTFMASGGIPGRLVYIGGKPDKIQMEHAWVETYIPYGNYRGAIVDDSLKTWIPMDGSYKQYTYTNGFDITSTVPFDYNAYMGQVQSQNAIHWYQSKIQQYLDANMPDTSIIDVKGYREITQETYHFLPSMLPYKMTAQLGTFDVVPTGMTAKVTFTVMDNASGSATSCTAMTPELAGKRITLSYIPATANDEALIAKYAGFLYDVPAYMLNLKPVLRIEGTIKLTGESTNLGTGQTLSMRFTQPNQNTEIRDKNLLAGAYYAIGMDLQGINENVLGKRNYKLNTNVLSETAGTLGNDELIGEHLYILATTYFLANDKVQKSGVKLFNSVMVRTISEGIASFTVSVQSIFGMPKSALPSGVNMDVAMAGVSVNAKDGDTSKEMAYMNLHGLVGSYNEHDVFEKIDGFSSVSAVKALQLAAAGGTLIVNITAMNVAQILPALKINEQIKADIQNAVGAGKDVTVSQSNVQINDWNGVGYIIKDSISGAGAYMISGGLAGSDSTKKADGYQIVVIHKEPYGWIKDALDPQARRTIVATAELAAGEFVAEYDEYKGGMSYEGIGKCSGLVRVAYWSAGICLDMWSPWATGDKQHPEYAIGSCGQANLMQRHKITGGKSGVMNFMNLVKHLNISIDNGDTSGIRTKNNPLVGDLVFWSNTFDRDGDCKANDEGTHVGIVQTAPDDNGTITFIHASSGKNMVVSDQIMNITSEYKSDGKYNEFMRNSWKPDNLCTKDQWDSVGKMASELFAGFGTIRDVICTDTTHK